MIEVALITPIDMLYYTLLDFDTFPKETPLAKGSWAKFLRGPKRTGRGKAPNVRAWGARGPSGLCGRRRRRKRPSAWRPALQRKACKTVRQNHHAGRTTSRGGAKPAPISTAPMLDGHLRRSDVENLCKAGAPLRKDQ